MSILQHRNINKKKDNEKISKILNGFDCSILARILPPICYSQELPTYYFCISIKSLVIKNQFLF